MRNPKSVVKSLSTKSVSLLCISAMAITGGIALAVPAPSAHAVTYSQILQARRRASDNAAQSSELKKQLEGVNSQLADEMLQLNNLTNNSIPEAQKEVTQAQSNANQAQALATAAQERLKAAQSDKARLEKYAQKSGSNYDASRAIVAEVARQHMRNSDTLDAMSILLGSKSAQQVINTLQVSKAISRTESQNASINADIMNASMNETQRLAAITQQIAILTKQEQEAADKAKQAVAEAQSKSDQLDALYRKTQAETDALKSKVSQIKSAQARNAAENLLIQAQIESFNLQYSKQQAAAQARAASIATQSQAAPPALSPSTSTSYPTPTADNKWGHPTGDVGNCYPFSQCTWWAYIRRHQLGLPCGSYFGNGGQWANSARRLGYQVNHTPSVGAIAVFAPGQDGASPIYGHVAIVERVEPDGSIITSNCGAVMDGRIYYVHITYTANIWFIHN